MSRATVPGSADCGFHPREARERQDPDFVVEGGAEVDPVEAAVVVDVVSCAVGGGGDDGAALCPGGVLGEAGGGLLVPG